MPQKAILPKEKSLIFKIEEIFSLTSHCVCVCVCARARACGAYDMPVTVLVYEDIKMKIFTKAYIGNFQRRFLK